MFKGINRSHISPSVVVASFLFLGILFTTYISYNDVFQDYYGQQNGRITRLYGLAEVGEYIINNSDPENTKIVLGDPRSIAHDAFVLHTKLQPYSVLYWEELVGPGKPITTLEGVEKWERNVLYHESNIFYVFGLGGRYLEMPGWNLFPTSDWGMPPGGWLWFTELHPGLKPSKTIYFNSGIPALVIYQVNNTTPRYTFFNSETGDGHSKLTLHSPNVSDVDFIKIQGPVNDLTITNDNNRFHLPTKLLPSQRISITYDNQSEIVFEPLFTSENYKQDVFEEKNIAFNALNGLKWIELRGESGYLIYKIESPFGKINEIALQTNPRLFNDENQKNNIKASYSVDNSEYISIYDIKSNGNNEWGVYIYPYSFKSYTGHPFQAGNYSGIFERQTYHVIRPNSEVVYIKFLLTGGPGQVQLWSPNGEHRMFFKAEVDTSSAPRLRLEPGLNIFEVHVDGDDSTKLSFATEDFVSPVNVLDTEDDSTSCSTLYNATTHGVNIDQWIRFDGNDDYVEISDGVNLDGISSLSVEMWFMGTGEGWENDIVFRKDEVFFGYLGGGDQLFIGLYNASSGVVKSSNGWNVKQWHHLVLTYDGITTKMYRNGVEVFSDAIVTGSLNNSTSPLLLGSAPGGTQPLNGAISETRIYNKVLSAQEISEHFQGLYSNDADLVLHLNVTSWDNNTGNWNDLSGQGNDGKIYGTTAQEGRLAEERLLIYNLDVLLNQGAYRATFRLKVADNTLDEPVAKVRAVAGDVVVGELTLTGKDFLEPNVYQDFIRHIDTDGKKNLTFRIQSYGRTMIWVDYVKLCPFEGAVILSGPGIRGHDPTPEGLTNHGPYPSLGKPGIYQAAFRLKVADNMSDEPVAKVDVVAGDVVVGELTLTGKDFREPNVYHVFNLNFNTDGRETLQYQIFIYAKTRLWIDYIDVSPLLTTIHKRTGVNIFDQTAHGSQARYASNVDQQGSLAIVSSAFGQPGAYKAVFGLKVADNTTGLPVAKIEVVKGTVAGDVVVGELTLTGKDFLKSNVYQDFNLNFNTDGRETLQYRTFTYANTDIWVDYVYLVPLPAVHIFNYENSLSSTGLTVADDSAYGYTARHAGGGKDGLLVRTPELTLYQENYNAMFRLKVADNMSDEPVAKVDVVAGDVVVGELTLTGKDFLKSNVYQDFTLNFDIDGEENLTFRVNYLGTTDLWVDNINVHTLHGTIFESENMLSHIGLNKEDAGAHNGLARYGIASDPEGLLVYGPGSPFGNSGFYQATFRLKVADDTLDEPVAKVDVVAGDVVVGELTLTGKDFLEPNVYQDFILNFNTNGTENLQYRVLTYAKTDLWVDYVEVVSAIKTFDSSDIPLLIGLNVDDKAARSGKARYASYSHQGLLIYSPDVLLDKGAYQAAFRLKVADNMSDEPVAKVDVVAGDVVVGELTLTGKDFLKSNVYQDFTLNFDIDGEENLTFRVNYLGTTDLWADNIVIYDSIL